jgi:hypothetical protein
MNNYQVLVEGKEPIVAYDAEFKGRHYFHIRKMYEDKEGNMQPGKGLAVLAAEKSSLIKALKNLK